MVDSNGHILSALETSEAEKRPRDSSAIEQGYIRCAGQSQGNLAS